MQLVGTRDPAVEDVGDGGEGKETQGGDGVGGEDEVADEGSGNEAGEGEDVGEVEDFFVLN